MGPTRGPARTLARRITQLPVGVWDVHAPRVSEPKRMQDCGTPTTSRRLGKTNASQPSASFAGRLSGAPTVAARPVGAQRADAAMHAHRAAADARIHRRGEIPGRIVSAFANIPLACLVTCLAGMRTVQYTPIEPHGATLIGPYSRQTTRCVRRRLAAFFPARSGVRRFRRPGRWDDAARSPQGTTRARGLRGRACGHPRTRAGARGGASVI